MKRRRTRAGSRTRQRPIWVDEPKIRGSKDERWSTDLTTGKRRRIRATTHTGTVVNEELQITCPRWLDDACDHCEVCGERSNQISLGVTWTDGEQRIRELNLTKGGGYRSRGPVLYAMHVIKLERFADRHFECGQWAAREWGGPIENGDTLPQYLIWALRFGTHEDELVAIARAKRADVPQRRLDEQIGSWADVDLGLEFDPYSGEAWPAPPPLPAVPKNLPGDQDIPF